MTVAFVCTSTRALDLDVLKITGTSPLTLLLYLQQRVNFATGERTLPYDHAQAAKDLGVTERTIGDYFVRLVKAGLIVARRLAHGVTFAITRPAAPGRERKESSVHFHAQEPDVPAERQKTSAHERQKASVQPSRGETPDSERTNQSAAVGGGGTMVGGPTALAPPGAAAPAGHFSAETLEAIRLGEEARRRPFTEEVRCAISHALDTAPAGTRWPVLQDTIRLFAQNRHWSQKVPEIWGEQVHKADDARRLGAAARRPRATTGWRRCSRRKGPPRMEPGDREAYTVGMARLSTLPGRGGATDAAALDATWWGELLDTPWITASVWDRAVSEAVRTCDFRPAFSEMLGICEVAVATLEQEAWRAAAPPLPPPTAEQTGATPEERERWAREDAFIRGHMAGVRKRWEEEGRLDDWTPHPTKPGAWIRTAPEDAERLWVSRAADEELARVPQMTAEQRRARERRIEGAKERARDAIRGFLRRHPRAPAVGGPAAPGAVG